MTRVEPGGSQAQKPRQRHTVAIFPEPLYLHTNRVRAPELKRLKSCDSASCVEGAPNLLQRGALCFAHEIHLKSYPNMFTIVTLGPRQITGSIDRSYVRSYKDACKTIWSCRRLVLLGCIWILMNNFERATVRSSLSYCSTLAAYSIQT